MQSPKITFITNDTQKEAEHISFLAKSICEGYFEKAGLLVLPKPVGSCVFFPNLNYSKSFWREIKLCKNRDFGYPFPDKAVNEVKEKLSKIKIKTKNPDIKKWKEIEKTFFKLFKELIGNEDILKKTSQIQVLYTKFGTEGSFFPTCKEWKYSIFCTLREDLPLETLVKTLLLAYYKILKRENAETGTNKWFLRQSTVDFLLKKTAFNKISPKLIKAPNSRQHKESEAYLKLLGFPKTEIKLNINNKIFTKQEQLLLSRLIQNSGEIVTFDQVADTIWSTEADTKFSLESMAKIVENIRKKIREQGINHELIHTSRGRGYVYLN